jgi:hypothetical protein
MLQKYVVNVLSVSDVCCSKCFMLQVFHEQVHQGEGGLLGRSSPRVCAGSEAKRNSRREAQSCIYGRAAGAGHEAASMGVETGAEHKAASMGVQQMWSTR